MPDRRILICLHSGLHDSHIFALRTVPLYIHPTHQVYEAEHTQPVRTSREKQLLSHIDKHFGTLAWCRRWLEDSGAASAR